MTTKTVYVIREENHGLIGVADSKEAVFSFLVAENWVTADAPCGYSCDDYRTFEEVCKEEGITEEKFLNWAIDRLEHTDFWENSGYYIREEELYTEKII